MLKKRGISDSLLCDCEDQRRLWSDAVRPERRPGRGGKNVQLLLLPRLITHLTTYRSSIFYSLRSKTTMQIFQSDSWSIKQIFTKRRTPCFFAEASLFISSL